MSRRRGSFRIIPAVPTSIAAGYHQVINYVHRCCGPNDSVYSGPVVDVEGIVEAVEDFTKPLKEVCRQYTNRMLAHSYFVFRTKLQHMLSC